MKKFLLSNMKGGWFAGAFEPVAYKNNDFELCVKYHTAHEFWERHYHTATEINCLIIGSMTINGESIEPGEIFVIEPYEIVKPEFLTDCIVVTAKHPAKSNDKYIVSEEENV